MTRIARVVVPDYPHHVIQRGNRKQQVFFSDSDRKYYVRLLQRSSKEAGLVIYAWCLMDNHVHFIVVPKHENSLRRAFGEAHRRYTRMINQREDWTGYLWQGRFLSYVLSEAHFYAAVRYVELNPVRAGMVPNAWDYIWSSAQAHVFQRKDALCQEQWLANEIGDWKQYLCEGSSDQEVKMFQKHALTGKPLGSDAFIETLEKLSGKELCV